jgi:hypothetical protein
MLIAHAMMPMASAAAKAVNEMDKVDVKPSQKSGRVSPITRKFKLDNMSPPMVDQGNGVAGNSHANSILASVAQ